MHRLGFIRHSGLGGGGGGAVVMRARVARFSGSVGHAGGLVGGAGYVAGSEGGGGGCDLGDVADEGVAGFV
jgi:hypothetical protein